MSTISIIGSGNMAKAIGTRAATHGHTVELMSRDASKAQALADKIGSGATVGTYGDKPAGDIVILAVLYASAVEVVEHYGDALAGKILVDITNPFNATGSGVVTSPGNSVADQVAAAAPDDVKVVKAFNTIFGGVIAADEPLDVFFAGDSGATASFTAFLESLGLRPLNVGGLEMAYILESAGILLMGVARNGLGFGAHLGAARRGQLALSEQRRDSAHDRVVGDGHERAELLERVADTGEPHQPAHRHRRDHLEQAGVAIRGVTGRSREERSR